jgi:hypothetical protein
LPNKKGKVDASVHPRAGPSNRQLWTCCRRAARGRDLVLSRREPLPTMLVPPAPPNQATRGRGLPHAAFALYRHDHAPPVWQMARSSTFGARGRLPVLPIPPTGRWSAGCEGDDDHGPLVYWPASITTGSSLPRLHHTGGELNEEPRQTSSQLCPDLVPTASCTDDVAPSTAAPPRAVRRIWMREESRCRQVRLRTPGRSLQPPAGI